MNKKLFVKLLVISLVITLATYFVGRINSPCQRDNEINGWGQPTLRGLPIPYNDESVRYCYGEEAGGEAKGVMTYNDFGGIYILFFFLIDWAIWFFISFTLHRLFGTKKGSK